MIMETRTDIHRPSSLDFDPEAYDCYGVWDMAPDYPAREMVAYRMEIINKLIKDGYRSGPGSSRQCGHCGAHIRYAALMVHTKAKEYIYVGETCLFNRFEQTKEEFQRVRQAAILKGQLHEKQQRIAQLFEDHPLLVWITYADQIENSYGYVNGFLSDLNRKLYAYGELSERQIEAAKRTIIQDTEKNDARTVAKVEEVASATPAPESRVTVTGEIVSIKEYPGYMPNTYTTKMLVKDDRGFKVWSTLPDAIWQAEKGNRVSFIATLTPAADDPYFAKAKRPTKAEILERAE
jgi:hypothetical protein